MATKTITLSEKTFNKYISLAIKDLGGIDPNLIKKEPYTITLIYNIIAKLQTKYSIDSTYSEIYDYIFDKLI